MKAGIGHLQDKLESFREEIKGQSYTVSDDTVTEVLRECELCFVQLNKRIKAGDDEAKRVHITSTSNTGPAGSHPSTPGNRSHVLARTHMMGSVANLLPPELDETASRMNTLRPFNQRIDLIGGDGEHRNNAGNVPLHVHTVIFDIICRCNALCAIFALSFHDTVTLCSLFTLLFLINTKHQHNIPGVYAAHDPNGGGDDNSLGDLEDDELTREKVN